MKNRKPDGTVRQSIIIDKCLADNLEAASEFTGRSKDEILAMALNRPIMRRLWSFVNPKDINPLANLLDSYQAYERYMNPITGESILQAVKWWVEKYAVKKDQADLVKTVSKLNSYICSHIPESSRKADSYFESVYTQAKNISFITFDMKADELREKVVDYVDVMLNGASDKNIMGEPYLYRNLFMILSDCFMPPAADEVKMLFNKLSDGRVLPYHNGSYFHMFPQCFNISGPGSKKENL